MFYLKYYDDPEARVELYDLYKDPNEMKNIADNHSDLVQFIIHNIVRKRLKKIRQGLILQNLRERINRKIP